MNSIFLQDYVNPYCRHELNLETGSVESKKFDNQHDPLRNAAGFGVWKKLKISGKTENVFIAIYVGGDNLIIRIGNRIFNDENNKIKVIRKSRFLFMKRIVILNGSEILFETNYWKVDYQVWPSNQDLFTFIVETTKSQKNILRFIISWNDRLEGKYEITQNYIDSLDQRVINALQR